MTFYMMDLYTFEIRVVEANKETERYIYLTNGIREKKISPYKRYFKTSQEAIQFRRTSIKSAIDRYKGQLQFAQDELERFNKCYPEGKL